jgi:hypothetical protein
MLRLPPLCRLQATVVLALSKPLGLCGEPFAATPQIQLFGRKLRPPLPHHPGETWSGRFYTQ